MSFVAVWCGGHSPRGFFLSQMWGGRAALVRVSIRLL